MSDTRSYDAIRGAVPLATRRTFLRRTGLLAGGGLAAVLAGCTRGDDEDNDAAEPGVPDDNDLEGAEDPGEEPGIATEAGVEEETVDETATAENEGAEEEGD